MTTILITQCLQRDFVDSIGPDDPLPNLLHVGYTEAARLLGPEPAAGPLVQLIDWALGLPTDAIELIHIRDWHDPDDPLQEEHLRRFGAHCIKDSDGARLILGMDELVDAAGNVRIVDSLTLNDFVGTDLVAQLERIRHAHGDGQPLRVGVVGVWTEAKVSFLLYDLKTRLGIDELATCTALTASASRAQHFNALSQLEKLFGVHCFESVAEFVDWLQPGARLDLPAASVGFEPRIGGSDATAALQSGDRAIVAHLFRDSTESCTLAAVSCTARGTRCRSTRKWYLLPALPRSVGFGPVCSPPRFARTLMLSMLEGMNGLDPPPASGDVADDRSCPSVGRGSRS
jgi:nicotinamidase-related amidase